MVVLEVETKRRMDQNGRVTISRRWKMRKALTTMALVMTLSSWGCLESHSNMGPVTAFETAYRMALEGKIPETEGYFTKDLQDFLKTNPDWDLEKAWAGRLADGAVGSVKVIERNHDKAKNRATIKFMVLKNDGTMEDGEESMVYEHGMWRFDKLERSR